MQNVILRIGENGAGDFSIVGKREQLAKMEIGVSGIFITIHHTCIAPKAEGKGLAKKLLVAMIEYVRKNKLKVVPYCYFVRRHFSRHPNKYADIWHKDEAGSQSENKSESLISA